MRNGALFSVLAGCSAGLLVTVAACVSESNPTGPQPGDLDGPCLQNSTCNAGLTCVVVGSSARCEVPDGGAGDVVGNTAEPDAADAGSDTSSTGDADADAAPPSCDAGINSNFTCAAGTPLGCYDSVSTAHSCVTSTNSCLNSSYTNPLVMQCFATANCQGSQPWCCLGGGSVAQLTGCPGALSMGANGGTTCMNTPCASSGQIPLCDPNAACPNGHACIPVKVTQPPGLAGQIFGVCAP